MPDRRILVVDDERPIRFALQRLLSRAGYDVTEAQDGCQAMREIVNGRSTAHPIDLMLVDIQMPGITGPELLQKLRAGGICPLVLPMAGALDEATAGRLQESDRPNVIEKPFSQKEVLERVAGLLADV